MTDAYPYIFRWDRHGRKGQPCRVTARGTLNNRRLEFQDGYVMIAPGTSIRRRRPSDPQSSSLPNFAR